MVEAGRWGRQRWAWGLAASAKVPCAPGPNDSGGEPTRTRAGLPTLATRSSLPPSMSTGPPGSRTASLQLALGVIGIVGLGVLGITLNLRSAPPATQVATPARSSAPPPASAAPVHDAGPPEPEWTEEDDVVHDTLEAQRESLLVKLLKFQDFSPEAIDEIRAIMATERWLGQGNPECTKHPMSRAECRRIRQGVETAPDDRERCGRKYMVPIYNPSAGEKRADARVCIDQFEFPNIPCEYPVTWVRANVAQRLCELQDKRLCDAHEWEGACAGAVLPPEAEYAWGIRPYEDIEARRFAMQHAHNEKREIVWAYGKHKDHKKCATGSRKSKGCVHPSWELCGTNTYPAGAFPECVSSFGVYDLHGNAAEHMNFPMSTAELASRKKMGQTEMKGSWFIFDMYEAHLDDCRWRAPDWHGGPVRKASSHMNYHLGFRCCRDLVPVEGADVEEPALVPAVETGVSPGDEAAASVPGTDVVESATETDDAKELEPGTDGAESVVTDGHETTAPDREPEVLDAAPGSRGGDDSDGPPAGDASPSRQAPPPPVSGAVRDEP